MCQYKEDSRGGKPARTGPAFFCSSLISLLFSFLFLRGLDEGGQVCIYPLGASHALWRWRVSSFFLRPWAKHVNGDGLT